MSRAKAGGPFVPWPLGDISAPLQGHALFSLFVFLFSSVNQVTRKEAR
jgi:hypothetical protein